MITKKEAFIGALMTDNYQVLEQLLEQGYSPNFPIARSVNKRLTIKTPIHIASSPQTIQLLLRFGANPNRPICCDGINLGYQSHIYYRVHSLSLENESFYSENIMALLSYQPFLINTREINRTLNQLIFTLEPDEPLQEYQRMLIRSSADLAKKDFKRSPLQYAQKLPSTELLCAMVCHNFPLHYQIRTQKYKYQLSSDVYAAYQQSEAAKVMRMLTIWPLITVLHYEGYVFPQELLHQIKCFIVAELDVQYQPECPFIFKYLDLSALMAVFERVYALLDYRVLPLHKKRAFTNDYSPVFFEKALNSEAEKKPNGRMGFAWQLTKKYRHQCASENPFFMEEVRLFKQKKGFNKLSLNRHHEKALEIHEKKEHSPS